MDPNCLNIIGLSLDMIGVVLIFNFAVKITARTDGLLLSEKDSRKENRSKFLGMLGLFLVLGGFAIQIYANSLLLKV